MQHSRKKNEESKLAREPLQMAPHTSHFSRALSRPSDSSRRFPQSVQKTSDPIAAMTSLLSVADVVKTRMKKS
jgi:hypothetical protein